MSEHSQNGDPINIHWDEEDIIPLAELQRMQRVVDWSSDDDMPLTQLKLKGNRKEIVWSSDDEIPLSKYKKQAPDQRVITRKRKMIDNMWEADAIPTKRRKLMTPDGWSSDDDLPLAHVKTKRAFDRLENEPLDERLNKRRKIEKGPIGSRLRSRKRQASSDSENHHHYEQRASKRSRAEPSRPPSHSEDPDTPVEEIVIPADNSTSNDDAISNKLKSIYYDPKHPAAFSSAQKLADAAGVSLKAAVEWLRGQDAYTLHRGARRKFKRRRYVVNGIGHLFQCDLLDMQRVASVNDGMRFILTCIDCFTRRLWAIPIPNKEPGSVIIALQRIFRDLKPFYLSFDSGLEFTARSVQLFLKENDVKYYTTIDQMKSAFVERVNRTLRERMTRYFTSKGTERYMDVLQQFVTAYNNTKHSAHGMIPLKILSADVQKVWHRLYSGDGRYKALPAASAYRAVQVKDRVRLARSRGPFEKRSATYNWTPEVFTVTKVTRGNPPMYNVNDDKERPIRGRLYKEEVQLINKDRGGEYLIDKILSTRGKGTTREVLVSWVGYPKEFNSWLKESQLRNL
jgi:hypothetical protein